jgi:type IV pilus assembly protein PilQ
MTRISSKQFDRSPPDKHLRSHCLILAATLLTGGCTIPKQTAEINATQLEWNQLAEDSVSTAPPAPEFPPMRDIAGAEAADAPLKSSRPELLPQISVKDMVITREMDVGVLLRALADAADLNIIISDSVSGPILVSLRRKTRWDRLFLAITKAHGLHYELEDDLLHIFSEEDIKRDIAMQQALQERLGAAEKRMRSEPMGISMVRVRFANIDNLAASVRATMQAVAADQDSTAGAPAPGAEAPAPGAEAPAPGIAGSRFMVKADKDTGQLILHGVPPDIARARKLIQGLDQPSYQILIEATIVQANNEVARQLGVQWGQFNVSDSGRLTTGITPRADGFNSNFPAGFDPSGSGFVYGVMRVNGNEILQAQLSALQKDGRLNIVSRPSVTTLDQLAAVIESGEERPFASSAGSGIATVSQIEFKKAALRLEVTPHVIDKNWVKLDIDTNKDDFDDTRAIIIDGNVQVPILTRSAVTSLYLANGQTTVIGGLSSETKSLQEEGIPFLKSLPGVGGLFRNRATRKAFNDTLIFITPHILPKAGTTANRAAK